MQKFKKSFIQQESIPESGIERAVEVMRSGQLHRYGSDSKSEVNLFELQFANYMGVKYSLACASCGYALYLALLVSGVKKGDLVLCNSFTLAPVPGAIDNAGATSILVETDHNLMINLDDLESKIIKTGAKFLLLSHMRGHTADMDRISDLCRQYEICLIEDCAHTMGASWNGRKSGTFGKIACFSTQTYKHLNSGEGGLLVTEDKNAIAKAILYSGSYMHFDQHWAAPDSSYFSELRYQTPNYSGRMDNLRAAILRPQLDNLDRQCRRWNKRYRILAEKLALSPLIELPKRPSKEHYVGSSIQFFLPSLNEVQIEQFIESLEKQGVVLKWFGASEPQGYTSCFDSWKYIEIEPDLPETKKILKTLLDMRIPLTFTEQDCALIGAIIVEQLKENHG